MRILTIFLFFVVSLLPVSAQKCASVKQTQQMVNTISRSAQNVKTMSGNFTQTTKASYLDEPAISLGKMNYSSNGNLLWQYTSPFNFTFQVTNGKAFLKSGKKTKEIDLKSSANIQKIATMVQGSITGKNLRNNKDFSVVMFVNGNVWIAKLTPKKPQMKKYIKSVSLYFDKTKQIINKVQMYQMSGDEVTIEFKDVKVTR